MGGQILNYMTDDEINIAITEACDWKFIPEYCHGEDQPPEFTTVTPDGRHLCGYYLNYCNDLNAMHEAEKALNRYQQSVTYSDNLMKIVGYHTFDSAHATARQRAEAFLRTLNLWTE